MSKAKRNTLLYLALGGILTAILATGLSNLVLAPGSPLPFVQPQLGVPSPYGDLPGGDVLLLLARGVMALALILLPVVIFYSLLTPTGRQRLLAYSVLIALILLVASYLQPRRQLADDNGLGQSGSGLTLPVSGGQSGADGLPHFPANPPAWIGVAIILAASVVISFASLWAIRIARQQTTTPESTLDKLGEQARNAIDELGAGGDLSRTVIRCYHEMNRVVREEKRITRESAMT